MGSGWRRATLLAAIKVSTKIFPSGIFIVEETGGGAFIHLVVSFVSTDNKREGSRKCCALPQKRG